MLKKQPSRVALVPSKNNFYLLVKILTIEIIEHKLYQNVTGVLDFYLSSNPRHGPWGLLDLKFNVHGPR